MRGAAVRSRRGILAAGLAATSLLVGCGTVAPADVTMTEPERPIVDRTTFAADWCEVGFGGCERHVEVDTLGTGDVRLIRSEPFVEGEFEAVTSVRAWLWPSVDGAEQPAMQVDDTERLSVTLASRDDGSVHSRVANDKGMASEGPDDPAITLFSTAAGSWAADGADMDIRLAPMDSRLRSVRDRVVALTVPPAMELGVGASWTSVQPLDGVETLGARLEVEVVELDDDRATLSFSGDVVWVDSWDQGRGFFGGWTVRGTVTWFESTPVPSARVEIVGEAEFDTGELFDDPSLRMVIAERRVFTIEPTFS